MTLHPTRRDSTSRPTLSCSTSSPTARNSQKSLLVLKNVRVEVTHQILAPWPIAWLHHEERQEPRRWSNHRRSSKCLASPSGILKRHYLSDFLIHQRHSVRRPKAFDSLDSCLTYAARKVRKILEWCKSIDNRFTTTLSSSSLPALVTLAAMPCELANNWVSL